MDESSTTNQNDELEQNLLTQFSCMGTTDKDDLIKQFQTIGECLNYSTATFFLEMNNWNLPAAVGCYFDFMANTNTRLPSMQFLKDMTVGLDARVTPSTSFTQSWLVQNNGEISWPDGTYLKVIQASPSAAEEEKKYYVPSLQPNDTTIITVNLVSPSELGSFQTKWRLCTPNGSFFGATIWSVVEVSESGTLAIQQQLAQLQTDPAAAATSSNDMEIIESNTNAATTIQQPNSAATSGTILADDDEMW